MVDAAKHMAEEEAGQAGRLYGEASEAARERVARLLGRARATGRRTVETLGETVETHPYLALLATFLAGIVVGHLLSRR